MVSLPRCSCKYINLRDKQRAESRDLRSSTENEDFWDNREFYPDYPNFSIFEPDTVADPGYEEAAKRRRREETR